MIRIQSKLIWGFFLYCIQIIPSYKKGKVEESWQCKDMYDVSLRGKYTRKNKISYFKLNKKTS